jgi:translation initiation factor eIF-2B subunit delta
MSGEPNGVPPEGAPQKTEEKPQQATDAASPKDKPAKEEPEASGATDEKKLTGAELKAKAKAEKAARRAQLKEVKEVAKGEAAVSSSPQQLGPSASEVKGKQKGKYDGGASASATRPATARASPSVVVTEQKVQIPECFSHLSMARRIPMTLADKDVHPSVLALGQQMATFAIDESIARLNATLLAFKRV